MSLAGAAMAVGAGWWSGSEAAAPVAPAAVSTPTSTAPQIPATAPPRKAKTAPAVAATAAPRAPARAAALKPTAPATPAPPPSGAPASLAAAPKAPATAAPPPAAPATAAPAPAAKAPPAPAAPGPCLAMRIGYGAGQAMLTPEELARLKQAAVWLSARKGDVVVRGFADALGADALNLKLSHQRASLVSQVLRRHGVDADRLTVQALGSYAPRVGLAPKDGRNRRVELWLPGGRCGEVPAFEEQP